MFLNKNKNVQSKVVYEITHEQLQDFANTLLNGVSAHFKTLLEPKEEEPIFMAQACKLLGFKPPTIYKRTGVSPSDHKYIPHYKKGGKLYFYKSELLKWLKEKNTKQPVDLKAQAKRYL